MLDFSSCEFSPDAEIFLIQNYLRNYYIAALLFLGLAKLDLLLFILPAISFILCVKPTEKILIDSWY